MEYITTKKFNELLTFIYKVYENNKVDYDEMSSIAFLDDTGFTEEKLKKINPLDVLRAINHNDLEETNEKKARIVSKILSGLVEEVVWVNRPQPKFANLDLIQGDDGFVYTVLDFYDDTDNYLLKITLNGEKESKTREYIDRNFVKIGTVTKDVLPFK